MQGVGRRTESFTAGRSTILLTSLNFSRRCRCVSGLVNCTFVLQRLASVAIFLRNAFWFDCCCCGLHFCRKRCGLNKSTITSVALLLLCSSQRVSSEHFSFFFERRGQLFGHLCNGVATWDGEALVKLALQVQTRCPCLFEHSQNKTTHCSVRGVRGQITQGQIMIRDPLTRGEEGGREHLTSR